MFISLGSFCSLSSMLMENSDEILKTLRVKTHEIRCMWIAELAIQQGPAFILQCTKVQLQGMRFCSMPVSGIFLSKGKFELRTDQI